MKLSGKVDPTLYYGEYPGLSDPCEIVSEISRKTSLHQANRRAITVSVKKGAVKRKIKKISMKIKDKYDIIISWRFVW
jgi:hypothetical protein